MFGSPSSSVSPIPFRMTNSIIFASFCCFCGLSLASTDVPSSQSCGKSNPISTGTSTGLKPGEYPWYASLFMKSEGQKMLTQVCGGAIITPRVILTAGHCTFAAGGGPTKAEDMKVAVGKFDRNWDVEEKDAQIFNVERIVLHPSFKKVGMMKDLALLILDRDIKISDKSLHACAPWTASQPVHKGDIATLISWNRTRQDTKSSDIHLRAVKGSYLDSTECSEKASIQLRPFVTQEKFCIDYTNETSAGWGDSGSGVTVENNGRHYLIGVGSLGSSEVSPIFIFQKLEPYKDWVQSVIKDVPAAL